MSEYQEDANEASSDLNEYDDDIAESSAALDDDDQELDDQETDGEETDEQSEEVAEKEGEEEIIRVFESDKANERFSKITAENKALKARLDAMETVPEYKDPGVPKEDDYPDYESHQAALIAYEAEKSTHQVLSQRQQAYREAQEQAERDALYEDHNRKRERLAASVKDLSQALDQSYLDARTPGGNAAAEAILRRDNSAEIEYFIAKNPEVAVRLNTAPNPYSVFDEISRISEALRVKPKKGAVLPKPVGASPSGGGRASEHKAVYSAGATFE